jgi:3'(2'), 5'-bisphosphate nucleotidase
MTASPDLDPASPAVGALIDEVTSLVSRAAGAVMAHNPSTVAARTKPDKSPVTAADDAAQAILAEGLSRLLPGVPVVSEEVPETHRAGGQQTPVVLVDPLDGTREYLAGRPEFTINLALVNAGLPLFGCIAAPAYGLVWRGTPGQRAERLELPPGADAPSCRVKTPIRTRLSPGRGLVIAVSRSHLDADTERFLAHFPGAERIAYGSALKFCRLAEGEVDLYPRLAPMHEWDVAAGHAIVVAAGGAVLCPDGSPLVYGRGGKGLIVPGFIAIGDQAAAARVASLASSAD